MRAKTCLIIIIVWSLCLLPTVTAEAVPFYPLTAYGVDDAPYCVAVDDLNGDGFPDLAVGNDYGDTVSVLLGNGDGTFQAAAHFAVDTAPRSIAIGDLNGDDNPDLVTANLFGKNVSVLLGNGDGTFQTATHCTMGNYYPTAVAIDDLDGDGYADLAVAASNFFVLFGNGDGTFQAAAMTFAANGCSHLAVGDLDGDSVPDVTLANYYSNNYVTVLLGNGDGTFATAAYYEVYAENSAYMSVAVADLDGDGQLDIAAVHSGTSGTAEGISVFMGNGDGTFSTFEYYQTYPAPLAILAGDMDGDSNLDLVTVSNSGVGVVLPGNGDGTFRGEVYYDAKSNSNWVASGDLNGDGLPDLAVPSYSYDEVTVVINSGQGFDSKALSEMTCAPLSGTLPFTTQIAIQFSNLHDSQTRRLAGRINIQLGTGGSIPNWRAGYTNIPGGESFYSSWNQNLPGVGSLVGDNTFSLVVEDVTSAPYNQPPYPPAGDTDTAACTVTGIAP